MTIDVEVREMEGRIVIAPKGRMDGVTTDTFVEKGQQALGDATKQYVLDLSDVPYVSSAGLRGVFVLAKAVREANGAFSLCIPEANKMVREVFSMSGFARVMTIRGTVEEALHRA